MIDPGKMKTTKEEEGTEGDEPNFEEFDEEKENDETEKKMKKGKEVSHDWEQLLKNKLLQGGRRPCCAGRHLGCLLDKVVDMPVVCNDRGLSSCESTSDSVHRRNLWTFQFATEMGMHSATVQLSVGAVYGGGSGDEGVGIFRAPPGRLELSASFRSPRL